MTTCYGVDIGAAQTVCCADDGEILRNELGGHTTASLVGYPARGERQLGEAATRLASSQNEQPLAIQHVRPLGEAAADAGAPMASATASELRQ